MSYNIYSETNQTIDWNELNIVLKPFSAIEYIPMPKNGNIAKDALGICIPAKSIGTGTWNELRTVIGILKKQFGFTLYDLYHGEIINDEFMDIIKNSIS